jgi:hypothetical protein
MDANFQIEYLNKALTAKQQEMEMAVQVWLVASALYVVF